MSIFNIITNTGITIGIPMAVIGTILVLYNLIKKKSILLSVVTVIAGIILIVPFMLCKYHGAEYVKSEKILIYSYDGEYVHDNPDGTNYVYVNAGNDYYMQRVVTPSTINNIDEGEEPYLQIVTTYWKYGIFETSSQVHILWIPKTE